MKTLLSKYADAFRYFKDSFLFMVILYILSLLIGIIIFKDSSYSINPQSVSFLYVTNLQFKCNNNNKIKKDP